MTEYIDREAVLKAFDDPVWRAWSKGVPTERIIKGVPAADVAPVRHGRWVLIRPGEWTATLKCSECGRHITVDPKRDDLEIEYPYCHCGAKMDGGDA